MSKSDTIVITGAGRGIGKAAAVHLARTGAHILCISQSTNVGETAREIQSAGGTAEALSLDLADYAHAEAAVGQWITRHPARQIGVVLAAAILGVAGPLIDTDLATWDLAYRVGVVGNLAVLKALLPRMTQARFGRIVGFSGGGSAYPYPIFPAYSASKTAMVRAIENLDEDLKDKGDFATVCLAPGAIETDLLKQVRNAGAFVKKTAGMEEPLDFLERFLTADSCGFSGRFVHARDSWAPLLNSGERPASDSLWKLRRIEP